MHVIGTAGHVDHGKSTLIAALTGINPDRLKEEQEREMTIDLGFAWLNLPNGEEVGIIDVPGHRDFIENMLSGVGGIDAALLVIAADEGIMPQTREHLAILDLLQIPVGLVVLTKVDLVDDPAWLELVTNDVGNLLRGTALQDAPILRVSSVNRSGFPELVRTLGLLLENLPSRPDLGRPRLPVDRVFSVAGFGTVVTGTLTDGQLKIGDEVEILPSGLRGRIRGLQTHKKKEQTAVPGSRTAVNISGIDVEQIQRGNVVTHPGQYRPTQRLDVRFHLLRDVSAPLHHHTEVKLFLGTAEIIADLRLLGTEALNPGEEGWLQLELRQPVIAVRGDHYILRRPSPAETLGGGMIVNPQPTGRHKRFDEKVIQELEALANPSPIEVLLQTSLALGPALARDIVARSQLEPSLAEATVQELVTSGQLIRLDDGSWTIDSVVLVRSQWAALRDSIVINLSAYHKNHPLRRGMPREELKSRLKLPPRLFNLVMQKMSKNGVLAEGPKWVALPEHKVRFSPFQQVKVDKLMASFAASPYAPPSLKECLAEVGEDILDVLLESGDLVAVSGDVVFRKEDYETMVEQVRQAIQQKGQITLAEVRDLFATSRRYVQAFLEYLDTTGITIREGDYRKLKT